MFIFVDAIKDMTKTACCQTLHVYLHVWNKRSCCAPQQDVRYYCSSLNMHIMLSFNVEHILNTLTMLNAGAWITCNLCSSDAESYMCAIIIKITKKKQSVDHLCWSSAAHKVRFLCMWSGHASQITPVCLLFISFTSVSLAKEILMSKRIPDKIKVIHFRYHRTAKSRHKTPQYVCQCKTNNKEYNKRLAGFKPCRRSCSSNVLIPYFTLKFLYSVRGNDLLLSAWESIH